MFAIPAFANTGTSVSQTVVVADSSQDWYRDAGLDLLDFSYPYADLGWPCFVTPFSGRRIEVRRVEGGFSCFSKCDELTR